MPLVSNASGSQDNSKVRDVLTVEEVALELRVSKAHAHNLINGKVRGVRPLPAIPLGRRRIVLRSTLERWQSLNERVLNGDILPASPEVDS